MDYYSIDQVGLTNLDSAGLYSFFATTAEGSFVSPENHCSSSVYSNGSVTCPPFGNVLLVDFFLNLDESAMSGPCEWMEWDTELPSAEDSEEGLTSSVVSLEVSLPQFSLILTDEDTKLDNQLSICQLLKAYGEATENGMTELAEAILARLEEKACLGGETVQRLAYYLIQSLKKVEGYLTHESIKNYREGFLAFYQIFPYGKFAHLLANSMILNSMPKNAETVRILDFDMGEGVQWASLVESLGRGCYQGVVKLTSIKWEEKDWNSHLSFGGFEKIRRGLYECADYFNMRLEVEEMEMEVLENEFNKIEVKGGGKEWLAFNCMVNLPHMGRVRSERHRLNFLKLAKDSLGGSESKGIITLGDGNLEGKMRDYSGLGCFLEGQFRRLQTFLESMDWYFPNEVLEARVVMECLFVAPYLSSLACFQKWEEKCINSWEEKGVLGIELEGCWISEDSVAEAKELVREGESLYWVRSCEHEDDNSIVLGYMETPLVQVSCWR